MVLRDPSDPLAQSRGIMGPLENATGVQNNRGRLRQRFDLIRRLGQGTYGKVQLGIDKETGQEVAIKTIKKSKIETEADLIRIRREIQIMSSVRHPHIIHIYEVFENREKMVLVMEYAAGGELYDYLSERTHRGSTKGLEDDEARRIFRQVASAVYYCHKHKICHRDLKLENILLDENFNAKIADFGLSNVFDETNLLKTFCGSPLYASPEIVRGTPYKGPEVDCWSLGVLLYTLVYGSMPFDGADFKRLVRQISHGEYPEPKPVAQAAPLIRLMLTVDPKKRADIRKVCAHPWVNHGTDGDCLAQADHLATQTPVRLDLLLALANCPAINHNQVVIEQAQPSTPAAPPPSLATDQVPPAGAVGGAPPVKEPVEKHADPHVKKPKRMKVQSKSKSSPMLELIKDVAEEELEMPQEGGNERDEEDACDTLSEISEIQTIAEDMEGGGVSKASTMADTAPKKEGKERVSKRDKSKVRGETPNTSTPTPSPVAITPTPPTPTPPSPVVEQPKLKKTEPVPEPKPVVAPKAPAKKASVDTPATPSPSPATPALEEKAPVKKKVVKPKTPTEPEKTKPVEEPPITPTPAPAPAAAEKPAPKDVSISPSPSPARDSAAQSPARKEKSATPPDRRDSTPASDSGEENRRSRLKDRADSVSPTRIERRNSKVISQKTAELIQNLETKVSPSGSTTMEPPPKPPGIKKIVIPSFKLADAKSKFESKPPRPLTTSVSRSKAAFEAKLQSQTSVEEKTPPKQLGKSDSPPVEPPPKPKTETPPAAAVPAVAEKTAPSATPSTKEEPKRAAETATPVTKAAEPVKLEKVTPSDEPAKVETPVAAPSKVAAAKGPGKIQIPTALASDKATPASTAANTSEVKPVLMETGKGGAKPAVMVIKGKASPLPDARTISPQTPAPATPTPTTQAQEPVAPQKVKTTPNDPAKTDINTISTASPDLSASAACNESSTCIAPPESDTEGETGKTGGTPPLGPAAAAKQKLLSKLPPATQPQPAQSATVNAATNGGPVKEVAAKKISSVITKISSADKGLNTDEGPKKFSTLPRAAKPETEKIIKTEVSFPVSAPSVPLPQAAPVQAPVQQPQPEKPAFQTQQSQSERIIPIKLVDDVVGTPTTTAATSASPSMVSVSNASRTSVPPNGAARQESVKRMDSNASTFSRQNSSETESCSMVTMPMKMEPIRKCPREFLIPIKLEGSGHSVTPREDVVSGGSTADASQAGEDEFWPDSRLRSGRFAKPKRYSSLLSGDSSFDDEASASAATGAGVRRASATTAPPVPPTTVGGATHTRSRSQGDEPTTPGGTFKRYRNRRHATAAADMPLDRSDSFSSAEEDEEDQFQVLTAESLFSNLLDRVRNLTRRINRDDPMMTPNWSTDPATFGLWGASPLREFMTTTSRAPSETRSFASSGGPGSYRRESSVTVSSGGAPGGTWRRSLSRDLSGDSDSGHSASINTANAQSRSQLSSRHTSDIYETGSARSLPLSTRRSPSYLSHRSVDNDFSSSSYTTPRSYSRTLSHSGASDYGSSAGLPPSAISRTLPLRRSLKTFDRSPQSILPEYDTTGPGGGGGGSYHHHISSSPASSLRHSLYETPKYDSSSSYLTRLRSASRDRSDREGSVSSSANRVLRSLYPTGTSGEANGWDGGQNAVSPSSSITASSYSSTSGILAGGGTSISPVSTTVSLNSESLLSPNSSSYALDADNNSSSRLLSVQEKMNNYSQYYQSLTQSPYRRLPMASPSQIHANSSSSFGVGLSELRNSQPSVLSRPVAFQPQPNVVPLKVDPPPMEIALASSTSDDGSATPCIQSPVSNPLSSVTSPSISPPQMSSPGSIISPPKSQNVSPKSLEDAKAAKPPSSSIPRWPAVSVRQHRPLSISSFPDGPRASSVTRVMSPPPLPEKNGVGGMNGQDSSAYTAAIGIASLKKRDNSRATSVERITRLLERKSTPVREMPTNTVPAEPQLVKSTELPPATNGSNGVLNGDSEKSNATRKPKFLQSLEKKWEKLTNSNNQSKTDLVDSSLKNCKNDLDNVTSSGDHFNMDININLTSCSASPEPNQAGHTSEESSSHDDTKFNESVLIRRALSPEKKVKTSRLAAAGGTVGFMLGKFKRMEETPPPAGVTSNTSKIPTGRPPVGLNGVASGPLASRLGLGGRRSQLAYTGAASDSILSLTAKEMGRTADSTCGDTGLLRSAVAIAQEKRNFRQPKLEVKKDMPSSPEGPSSPSMLQTKVSSLPAPQIQIMDDPDPSNDTASLPKVDLSALSPISITESERTESDESGLSPNLAKSESADDADSVSDRILRKSFYNRFNATGIDRNRRSHSVTPGSSRRSLGSSGAANLRVNATGPSSSKGSPTAVTNTQPLRRSISPSASTVASAESKESSEQSSTQNRSPSPYWSSINKYNPNPLFKELLAAEDLRPTDIGKKTEYSRRITSKLSKLLREIESDLNSCQLTKSGSDDGDNDNLILTGLGGGGLASSNNTPLIPNRVTSPMTSTSMGPTPGQLSKRSSSRNGLGPETID